ncbi:hypothetical protein V0M98_38655 (plasmid) [Pseudomonas silesiensis]|uniref:hypothetical protein n=1 Tax=Pseudomonas silesiensis TaxID=1853130 RepID=UPI0030D2CFC9
MLKRMLFILPVVLGSLPVVIGSAWIAAFWLGWKCPNIFELSVALNSSETMNFMGFVFMGFVAWPIVGVIATLPLLKLYEVRKLARRKKLVAMRAAQA